MKSKPKQTKKVNRDELNIESKQKKKTKSKNRKKNDLSKSKLVVIKNIH